MAKTPKKRAPTHNNPSRLEGRVELTQIHSGPLPTAEEFERYETTLSGAADRILKLAEHNTAEYHRHVDRDQTIVGRRDIYHFITQLAAIGLTAFALVVPLTPGFIILFWLNQAAIGGIYSAVIFLIEIVVVWWFRRNEKPNPKQRDTERER